MVCKNIEKLICSFLWEEVEGGKGSHLVRWEVIEKSVYFERLEIESLRTRNKALLAKWLLHFTLEPDLSGTGLLQAIWSLNGCRVGLKAVTGIYGGLSCLSSHLSLTWFIVWWGEGNIFVVRSVCGG